MNRITHSIFNFCLTVVCFYTIYITHSYLLNGAGKTVVLSAFGAVAVLVFSNEVKKTNYRKVLMGSLMAAFIGVTLNYTDLDQVFKITMAIGSCILFMNLKDFHYPPGGAISLIPIIGNEPLKELGYLFLIYPVLTGIIILYFFNKIQQIFIQKIQYGK